MRKKEGGAGMPERASTSAHGMNQNQRTWDDLSKETTREDGDEGMLIRENNS